MIFQAPDPDFRQRVAQNFARQQAMHSLHVRLARVEAGEVELQFPYQSDYTQQHGFMHAGIVSTVLDSACGYAAFSLMPADAAVLSIEFKTNLLAPAKAEQFRVVGRVIKPGRTITVCEAHAYAISPSGEKLIATMTATLMSVIGREDIRP